jgi:hypothetical protein
MKPRLGRLVGSGLQAFHLLLESKLLTLQVSQSIRIGGRVGEFLLNGALEGLMTKTEFANASVEGHWLPTPLLTMRK